MTFIYKIQNFKKISDSRTGGLSIEYISNQDHHVTLNQENIYYPINQDSRKTRTPNYPDRKFPRIRRHKSTLKPQNQEAQKHPGTTSESEFS